MNEKDLRYFEKKLLLEREEVLKRLKHFRENNQSGDNSLDSTYDQHMAELASDEREREKNFYFASEDGRHLYEIDMALARIKENVYGICESCGADIGKERLDFVPTTRYCITCKEKEA